MIRHRLALSVLLAASSAAPDVVAQEFQVASRGPRFVAASGRQLTPDADESVVLRRRVTLALDSVPLSQALRAVVEQAGLEITYRQAAVPVGRLVSIHARDITVAAVLTDLLFDLDVDVSVTRSGHLALIPRSTAARRVPAGSVVGRVTDVKTGLAVAGADVLLNGTRWRTTADTNGRYRLAGVEAGKYALVVRRIGYAKHERPVTVAEGEDTVDIVLEPLATRLTDLVTTVTGRQRRSAVPNDITTINADSVMQTQPVRSVSDLLEGRVPGLTAQRTSGAPGDPMRLRLRGASSPNLNNDPIVVVDGVRVYAQQSADRSTNLAVYSAGGGGSTYTYDFATPSPLDYIDPNSIETIEVAKGPSAATLYGQDAANGVIVITTKKGKAGPTRWNMSLEHGRTEMVKSYPERVMRFGHVPFQEDRPVQCSLGNVPDPGYGTTCVPDSLVHFQLLNDPDLTPLRTGRRTAASLGAAGGVGGLTYSVTGSYSNELGLIRLPDFEVESYTARLGRMPEDWMRRPQRFTQWGVSSQLSALLGPKADINFRASLSQSDQQRSALEQQLGNLDVTYFDRASGTFPLSSVHRQNYYTRVTAAATSLTTGLALNWRPWAWLSTAADAGINVVQRVDGLFLPRNALHELEVDSVGALSDGQGRTLVQTLNLRASATRPLGGGFLLRLSTGANYSSQTTRDIAAKTTDIPAGQEVPGVTLYPPLRSASELATFGWYVEPALSRGTLNLISGVRLDGGSSYGSGIKLPAFPKLGANWLISDEPFFPFKTLFSSLRLRAAYGRASRQPGPTDRLRLYTTTPVVVGGQIVNSSVLASLGNTRLRPERTSEFEGGFDADLLDSRASLTVTGYRKTTDDALVTAGVPISLGGGTITRNIGVTRNTGLDVLLEAQLVRTAPVTWTTNLNLSHRRDEVVRLGPGVEPFNASGTGDGGFGTSQRVVPGYPLNGFWARPVVGYADVNGDGVITAGEIVLGDTAVYRGSPLPDYTATLSSSISLWRGALQLTAALLYDNGMTQHPNTGLLDKQITVTAGRNDPSTSAADQARSASPAVTDYYWFQQVSTTRLNAVSVSYTVPQAWARRLRAERLSVSVQGQNLGVWSNYRGVDPNVNSLSNGNLLEDNGALPQPRTWQVRINATY